MYPCVSNHGEFRVDTTSGAAGLYSQIRWPGEQRHQGRAARKTFDTVASAMVCTVCHWKHGDMTISAVPVAGVAHSAGQVRVAADPVPRAPGSNARDVPGGELEHGMTVVYPVVSNQGDSSGDSAVVSGAVGLYSQIRGNRCEAHVSRPPMFDPSSAAAPLYEPPCCGWADRHTGQRHQQRLVIVDWAAERQRGHPSTFPCASVSASSSPPARPPRRPPRRPSARSSTPARRRRHFPRRGGCDPELSHRAAAFHHSGDRADGAFAGGGASTLTCSMIDGTRRTSGSESANRSPLLTNTSWPFTSTCAFCVDRYTGHHPLVCRFSQSLAAGLDRPPGGELLGRRAHLAPASPHHSPGPAGTGPTHGHVSPGTRSRHARRTPGTARNRDATTGMPSAAYSSAFRCDLQLLNSRAGSSGAIPTSKSIPGVVIPHFRLPRRVTRHRPSGSRSTARNRRPTKRKPTPGSRFRNRGQHRRRRTGNPPGATSPRPSRPSPARGAAVPREESS